MFYVGCIIEGLSHLHERKIAHRCLGMSAKMLGEGGFETEVEDEEKCNDKNKNNNNKKKRRQ